MIHLDSPFYCGDAHTQRQMPYSSFRANPARFNLNLQKNTHALASFLRERYRMVTETGILGVASFLWTYAATGFKPEIRD
jgi:hypothetical protein